MNVLDRTIAYFSPVAGERRARARARTQVLMNYDAASKGRRTYGWKAPGSDADAALQTGHGQLRKLSRDMIRNRWVAARAQSVVTSNVVGTGISWSVTAEPTVREKVDKILRGHLGTTAIDAMREQTLAGLQQTVMNTVFSDGEVLVRRRFRDPRFEKDLGLPFQIELLEADYLDQTKTWNGKNEIIDGIEYGPTGRIVAYHLYRDHPGGLANWSQRRLTSDRVPAQDILHIRRLDRSGQTRGVPWLAPVLMTVGELSDYQEAEILKQRMAALLAAVVTTDVDEKFEGKGLEELAPGAVVGLQPGQEVTFSEPPTVTGYGDFLKRNLAGIAVGIGITYESLSGDLQGTNYTSFKAGRMEMDRLVETWQQQIMVEQFCAGVARWIDEVWPMVGPYSPVWREIRGLKVDAFSLNWTAPRRPLVEPSREIPAMITSIDGGLTSRQRVQRQLGYDPDQIRKERIEDEEKDREANLAAPAPAPAMEPAAFGPGEDDGEDGQAEETSGETGEEEQTT